MKTKFARFKEILPGEAFLYRENCTTLGVKLAHPCEDAAGKKGNTIVFGHCFANPTFVEIEPESLVEVVKNVDWSESKEKVNSPTNEEYQQFHYLQQM